MFSPQDMTPGRVVIKRAIIPIILFFLLFLIPCASFSAKGVQTRIKKYSLFTYRSRLYLCEPYLVQKDDWLYKIFRQKGEISASDFPLFLKIFKSINPQIRNIDAISPGSQILIPLKQVEKGAYKENSKGIVEVPVLAFSTEVDSDAVASHTHEHTVKSGDTLASLLPKEFLSASGTVSSIGEKTIRHLNPDMKNINRIYEGTHIVLPDASMISQPWFSDLIVMGKTGTPPENSSPADIPEKKKTVPHAPRPLSTTEVTELKRYTRLIQGHLMHQGRLFFPSVQQDGKPQSIDLSTTPVIHDDTGRKIVLLGPDETEASMNPDLVAAMRTYWKKLQFEKCSEVLNASRLFTAQTMKDVPKSPKSLVEHLVGATSYTYEPHVFFPISANESKMTVSLGRITHNTDPSEILINSGNVYGAALDTLQKQGYQILDLPAGLSFEDICTRLFSRLGYQISKNPSFNTTRRVYNIPGLYVEKEQEKLFLTRTPLFKSATTFLEKENIDVIML